MQITSVSPSKDAINVRLRESIVISFDTPIDAGSIDESSVIVSTDKPSIVSIENDMPQPGGIFGTDDFFSDMGTSIVKGRIEVSDNTLTFIPEGFYKPDTAYRVSISDLIYGTDRTNLGTLKYYSFSTTSPDFAGGEDGADPLADMPEGLVTIIGKNLKIVSSENDVLPESTTPTEGSLSIISTTPRDSSFFGNTLNGEAIIKIRFNKKMDNPSVTFEEIANHIEINAYKLLEDRPEVALQYSLDYRIDLKGKEIHVYITEPKPNVIYEVRVLSSLSILGENNEPIKLCEDYEFTFIQELTPYYVSTKRLRLESGSLLKETTDINLALIIHLMSIEADNKTRKVYIDSQSAKIMKGAYVFYRTLETVFMNSLEYIPSDFISKQLAEFSLSISSKTKLKLYNKLIDDIGKFKEEFDQYLNTICSDVAFQMVPRNKDIGRLWDRRSKPGLNSKVLTDYGRLLNTWNHKIFSNEAI